MGAPTASVLAKTVQLLNATSGLTAAITGYAALSTLQSAPVAQSSYVPEELQEQSTKVSYPSCRVYCDEVQNKGNVKFREFSGDYQMVAEVTHSQDRLGGLTEMLQATADAVGAVLESNQGNLGDGMVLQPGYEVRTTAVAKGGLNYLQRAKVVFRMSWER
jgi:hypothetical protein